jgi:hypothetical protein
VPAELPGGCSTLEVSRSVLFCFRRSVAFGGLIKRKDAKVRRRGMQRVAPFLHFVVHYFTVVLLGRICSLEECRWRFGDVGVLRGSH